MTITDILFIFYRWAIESSREIDPPSPCILLMMNGLITLWLVHKPCYVLKDFPNTSRKWKQTSMISKVQGMILQDCAQLQEGVMSVSLVIREETWETNLSVEARGCGQGKRTPGRVRHDSSCPVSVLAYFCFTTNRSLSICSKHTPVGQNWRQRHCETWTLPLDMLNVLGETDLGTIDSTGMDQGCNRQGWICCIRLQTDWFVIR